METVDTKQENYQNQSTDKVDKTNTITSISPKEHVETRPKDGANAEGIEEEIGNIAPGKYKNIPKKILNFIQQNHGEIYWTPDKELIVDGKIIRNTNIINLITHLVIPENRKWEFPRHHLRFLGLLGEGCFGQVWKCETLGDSEALVAVKTLK
ncbi:tyrosine kinase receptor Cad96Ca, partial [Nephila pilipes]